MTSTTINRTAIATTLLGLLATITGAQAQAQCVCSPRQYVVSFDLAQNCDNTNDIRGLPGIQSAFPDFCNPQLSEVTQVIIDENDSMLGSVPIRTVIDVDPPAKSGDILYTSMSDELNAGVRLEDQLDRAPSAIVVQMFGNDEDGNRVSRPFLSQISYTNECGSGPIDFQNSGLGYHSYTTVEPASAVFCPGTTPRTPSPAPTPATSMSYSSSMSISTTLAKAGKGKAAKKTKTTKT